MFVEPRKKLIDWVRRQLVGPPAPVVDGPELRNVLPTGRFPCGALYPASRWGEGIDPASEDVDGDDTGFVEAVDAGADITSENPGEPAIVRRFVPPSSLGFSFFIKGEDIRFQVLCHAVRYQHVKRNDWARKELVSGQGNDEELENISGPGKDQRQRFVKLADKARLDVLWRSCADGWIVTVSLSNAQQLADSRSGKDYVDKRAEKTLFEVSLRCVIDAGEVGVYPRVDRSLLEPEEQEIELQYAHRHVYAIGHGCAADWALQDGRVVELRSETMPAVEVPQMTADTGAGDEPVLSPGVPGRPRPCARNPPSWACGIRG